MSFETTLMKRFVSRRPIVALLFILAHATVHSETVITFEKEWGTKGAGLGQFDFPIDIAITPNDEILVTDHYNARVQRFSTDGTFISSFPVLTGVGGIALGPAGNIVLTYLPGTKSELDTVAHCLTIYSPDGTLIQKWGKKGKGDGEFDCPGGLVVNRAGEIIVADQTNHRIQVFSEKGELLRKWGSYGNAPGQFGGMDGDYSRTGGPQFVALDAEENIWTTEGMNGRIQKFTPAGQPLLAWGDNEDKPGHFGGRFDWPGKGVIGKLQGPIVLKFDSAGKLWVGAVCGRVQRFNPDGTYLGGLTAPQGSTPGRFLAPHGIAFDSMGNLYIVDSFNHRIQKFSVTEQATAQP